MSLGAGTIVADPGAPLARRNPVAKLGAAVLFCLPLLAVLDPVTPALALALELAVAPLFGLRYADLARRAWPLFGAAAGVAVTMVLFAADRSGTAVAHLGPLTVTTGVLVTASALAVRIFAVAVPGIIVVAGTDPTDLADALIQNVKASPRFAIGALAAFRMVPLLSQEWQLLLLARRARGIDAGRNPVARLRLFASVAFALLVAAIRRGTRLAVAMDARGFDSRLPRTSARRQAFGRADAALLLGAAALGVLVLVAARVLAAR